MSMRTIAPLSGLPRADEPGPSKRSVWRRMLRLERLRTRRHQCRQRRDLSRGPVVRQRQRQADTELVAALVDGPLSLAPPQPPA
jgi:hypothetical protein